MPNLWTEILDEVTSSLREHGIDLDEFGCTTDVGDGKVKVVFMAPGLADSVKAMNKSVRDKVVMVRLDEESSRTLDDWVDAGAVKSRSEAAALFIREGLQVRAGDLARLQDALRDLEDARDRLRRQARDILGKDPNGGESEADESDDDERDHDDRSDNADDRSDNADDRAGDDPSRDTAAT